MINDMKFINYPLPVTLYLTVYNKVVQNLRAWYGNSQSYGKHFPINLVNVLKLNCVRGIWGKRTRVVKMSQYFHIHAQYTQGMCKIK